MRQSTGQPSAMTAFLLSFPSLLLLPCLFGATFEQSFTLAKEMQGASLARRLQLAALTGSRQFGREEHEEEEDGK